MALIAAIMAPTDAALGQAVVTNKQVPQDERQSLIAESGLNDGLALPVILILASLVSAPGDTYKHATNWYQFTLLQLVLGPLVGMMLGWIGAKLFLYAESRELTEPIYEGVAVLSLAGSSFVMAGLLGGNGALSMSLLRVKAKCWFGPLSCLLA